MDLTLYDLRQFIYDNYGQEPKIKKNRLTDCLYYPQTNYDITIYLANYDTCDSWNGKQFISYSVESKNGYSGRSNPVDSLEELKEYLDEDMDKIDIQISLF